MKDHLFSCVAVLNDLAPAFLARARFLRSPPVSQNMSEVFRISSMYIDAVAAAVTPGLIILVTDSASGKVLLIPYRNYGMVPTCNPKSDETLSARIRITFSLLSLIKARAIVRSR